MNLIPIHWRNIWSRFCPGQKVSNVGIAQSVEVTVQAQQQAQQPPPPISGVQLDAVGGQLRTRYVTGTLQAQNELPKHVISRTDWNGVIRDLHAGKSIRIH